MIEISEKLHKKMIDKTTDNNNYTNSDVINAIEKEEMEKRSLNKEFRSKLKSATEDFKHGRYKTIHKEEENKNGKL